MNYNVNGPFAVRKPSACVRVRSCARQHETKYVSANRRRTRPVSITRISATRRATYGFHRNGQIEWE